MKRTAQATIWVVALNQRFLVPVIRFPLAERHLTAPSTAAPLDHPRASCFAEVRIVKP
jgi:hypothetical protein